MPVGQTPLEERPVTPLNHRSWLEIDWSSLEANLAAWRGWVGSSVRLCAVVKADAYGLGATRIAHRLAHLGVEMLGVYSPEEAAALAASGVSRPMLILMPVRQLDRAHHLYRLAIQEKLHLTIHDTPQLQQVNQIGRSLGCRLPVHLYLDTGMSRSGLSVTELSDQIGRIAALRYIRLAGLYTHLAAADSDPAFIESQINAFDRWIEQHQAQLPPDVSIHVANTFAALRSTQHHRSMVRIGLGLWGYGDTLLDNSPQINLDEPLQPIVRWVSRINHIQRYLQGSPVGYGSTHRLAQDSVLAVVPMGYSDGYPLTLGNQAMVGLEDTHGRMTLAAPVVGQVSMDQIVINLSATIHTPHQLADADGTPPDHDSPTDVAATAHLKIGSCVELISNNPGSPCALPQLAKQAGSNCYELLCRLSPRLPRRYTTPSPTADLQVVPQRDRRDASTHRLAAHGNHP